MRGSVFPYSKNPPDGMLAMHFILFHSTRNINFTEKLSVEKTNEQKFDGRPTAAQQPSDGATGSAKQTTKKTKQEGRERQEG